MDLVLLKTVPRQLVLRVFLADPAREWYGLEVSAETGLRAGTVYPILTRLEEHGWLVSRPEGVRQVDVGRPPRKLYRLVEHAIPQAEAYAQQWTRRG